MNRPRRGDFARIVAATLCVAIPAVAVNLPARQSSAPPVAKQEVPDNLVHPTAPEQPIPYSHKTHLAVGLTCQVCHTNPEPGKLMTFPVTSTCMQCHVAVAADKPAIQTLASFAKSGATIPWVRVYSLTSGVNWSHRKHLDAGMKCQMCHGDVARMSTMSEATSVLAMGVCITCHEAHKAPVVCSTCHSWPSH